MLYKIQRKIKDNIHMLKQMWKWRHVLKNSYDFDSRCLLEMILYKLKCMQNFYLSDKVMAMENEEQTVTRLDSIEAVIDHLERYISYEEILNMTFGHGTYDKEIFKILNEERQAILDKAFALISKHIEEWWD